MPASVSRLSNSPAASIRFQSTSQRRADDALQWGSFSCVHRSRDRQDRLQQLFKSSSGGAEAKSTDTGEQIDYFRRLVPFPSDAL